MVNKDLIPDLDDIIDFDQVLKKILTEGVEVAKTISSQHLELSNKTELFLDNLSTVEGLKDIIQPLSEMFKGHMAVVRSREAKFQQDIATVELAVSPTTSNLLAVPNLSVSQVKQFLPKGAHIFCVRKFYTHHGIYDGQGYVYEYGGGQDFGGTIAHSSLEDFSEGDLLNVLLYEPKYTPNEIIERAQSRLNEDDYNVFANNCAHFAFWCRLGDARVKQVDWRQLSV